MFPRALILLCLPLADAVLLIPLGRLLGNWLWLWTLGGSLLGLLLLRGARHRMWSQRADGAGAASLQALLDHRRTVLAGLLFLWPGLLSDLAAMVLLATAPPIAAGDNWEFPLTLRDRRQAFGNGPVA